jgi:hypothetical protein
MSMSDHEARAFGLGCLWVLGPAMLVIALAGFWLLAH